jgi:uncharacterized membrane protein
MEMAKRDFWSGFAAGTAAGLGGFWAANRLGRGGSSRIIRLEKSVQIGRPVEEVFDAWSDFSRLVEYSNLVRSVQRYGDRSHWVVEVGKKVFEWDAEITQIIPNEAIGWKSVSGMKNTGRITFAPLREDTMVHIQMNYAPPMRLLRPMLSGMSGQLESYIEQALRDFKHAMESGAGRSSEMTSQQATGTHGGGPETLTRNTNEKYGAPSVPVEYTRPPEAKR